MTPVLLPWPSLYVCRCAPPDHGRGIARCEWNERRGWRPRPIAVWTPHDEHGRCRWCYARRRERHGPRCPWSGLVPVGQP